MKHLIIGITMAAFLLGCESTSAAAAKASSNEFTVGASIDGQGSITQIQNGPEMPASIVAVLQEALPHWRFVPVMRNGKPAVVHTFINTRVLATPTTNGKFQVRVDYIGAGPMSVPGTPTPIYPADAVRSLQSGLVLISYDVLPDGSHTGVEVKSVDGSFNDRLAKPVREWVKQTRSTPETVNGESVPGHVTSYVLFSLGSGEKQPLNARQKKLLMSLGFTWDGDLEKTPVSGSLLKPARTEPVVFTP